MVPKIGDDFIIQYKRKDMLQMKVAVIGSRKLNIKNLEKYLPKNTTEIVSGGAAGVDTSAREYAKAHNLKLKEFLPEYEKYRRSAPLKRNIQIIEYADMVIAFWDGESRGTKYVINECKKREISLKIYLITDNGIRIME